MDVRSSVSRIVKPDTILDWHRKLVAQKFDGSKQRQTLGRPRIDKELEALVVRLAKENRPWGYDRIVGALANLGYTVSDQTVGNMRNVPWWVVATWCMSFESLNQLSATTIGGGSTTPPRRKAATRPSSMPCIQCSLSRHGAPGPGGSGRRMAKSTGTTNFPSPTTTTSNTPSIPESTRCSCPLH